MNYCSECREEVSFYEQDGLYYCTMCQSQSQDMQVMEYDQMDSQLSQSSCKTRTIRKHKKSAVDSEMKGDDRKSWWLAEVFQIILKAQVDTLIEMGVNRKLDDFVQQLWFRYLHNSGWALHSSPQEKSKKKANGESKTGKRKRAAKEQEDETKGSLEKASSKKKESNGCKKSQPLDAERFQDKKSTSFRLHHLICLLYLALRLLREPVLLSDLLRWVLEGRLPYYATSDLIPQRIEQNFTQRESQLFRLPRPSSLRLSQMQTPLAHLIKVLDLDPLTPRNLQLVISRFIVSLGLPGDFHRYTHQLMTRHMVDLLARISRSGSSWFPWPEEAPALAYIIIAIKLAVGLDDETENALSNVGRKLRSKLPADSKLQPFVWEEWVAARKIHERSHLMDIDLLAPSDVRQVRNVDKFIDHHVKTFQLDSNRAELNKFKKYQRTDMKNTLQRLFQALPASSGGEADVVMATRPEDLAEDLENKKLRQNGNSGHGSQESPVDEVTTPIGSAGVHWLSKKHLRQMDFSQQSTEYLVNLEKFCKRHSIQLDSAASSPAAAMDTAGGDAPHPEDEEHLTGERKKKKMKKKRKRKREGYEREMSSGGCGEDDMRRRETIDYEAWKRLQEAESCQPCPVDHSIFQRHRGYLRYSPAQFRRALKAVELDGEATPAAFRPFHKSYQWLLEHCAALYGLNWTDIHRAILELEKGLFELSQ
ncbi:TATA box-binding protein-associated factor RNA polymerase I subunit B-like [Diadema setosum]|uniref:TATA box-binding protein-associated factor RNA polymerase I subunit B-like n=1 Tax=Diadema setosum TaxID=31175 RepID=UPI003B3B5614